MKFQGVTMGLKDSRIQERASDNICDRALVSLRMVSRGLKPFAKGTPRKHKLSNAHIGSPLVILKKETSLTGSLGAKIVRVIRYMIGCVCFFIFYMLLISFPFFVI